MNPGVRLACVPRWDNRALSGSLLGTGSRLDVVAASIEEGLAGVLDGSLDAAEVSAVQYMIQRANGDDRLIAIPVFPYRAFRHGIIWLAGHRGTGPAEELRGRRVAIGRYVTTALVHVRGMLRDEYGLDAAEMTWLRTQEERAGCVPPSSVPIVDVRDGRTPWDLARDGHADAVIDFWHPTVPQTTPPLGRLFPDVRAAEIDYHRRTGVFPVMHVLVISKRTLLRAPSIARDLFAVWRRVSASAAERLSAEVATSLALTPWSYLDFELARRELGTRWGGHGVEEGRAAIISGIKHLHEQGLIPRTLSLSDVFPNEGLN